MNAFTVELAQRLRELAELDEVRAVLEAWRYGRRSIKRTEPRITSGEH